MYTHILLPTDGSRLANAAARAGIELARTCGARVTGLFVAPPATPIVYRRLLPTRYMTPTEHAALTARAGERYLGTIAKAAAAAGVPCETLCVTSDFIAEAIVRTAERRRCDLILMASRARRGFAATLLGSETRKVLAQAKVPVLVHR